MTDTNPGDPTDNPVDPVDLNTGEPHERKPVSGRQARYDELIRQGLSSQDALVQEEYEYRTARDNKQT